MTNQTTYYLAFFFLNSGLGEIVPGLQVFVGGL